MKTISKPTILFLEEESVIKIKTEDVDIIAQIEKFMQEESYYGDPDFSYY